MVLKAKCSKAGAAKTVAQVSGKEHSEHHQKCGHQGTEAAAGDRHPCGRGQCRGDQAHRRAQVMIGAAGTAAVTIA